MALPDKTPELCRCGDAAPAPEELARANSYGLLARLFYAPPDAALLDKLAGAQTLDADEGLLPQAWQALLWAAARAVLVAVNELYRSAFVGTRKSRVSLYATAYMPHGASKAPALRATLAELGLARHGSSREPVDHIAGLCDVMRHLIQTRKRVLAQQRRFFSHWIAPAAPPLCSAVAKELRGTFYEYVAHLAAAFFEVEQSAFAMSVAQTPRRFASWNEPETRLFSKRSH
jgi:TorA maturation chaperone TorD